MRTGWRLTTALGFVGVVAMSAAAFGQVGVDDSAVDAPPAQEAQDEQPEDRHERLRQCRERFEAAETDEERAEIREECKPRRHGRFGHGRRIVTGEMKVQTDDGFATVLTDQGTVTAVGSDTLTIERADGETVTVTAGEETKVRRGREEAGLDDVEIGDVARIVRVDDGDGVVVRAILVHPRDDASDDAEPAALRAA